MASNFLGKEKPLLMTKEEKGKILSEVALMQCDTSLVARSEDLRSVGAIIEFRI